MLRKVKQWFEATQSDFLRKKGIGVTLEESPSDIDKPSIRLDFESDVSMARLTVWTTGECQLEIVDIETEKCVYDEYLELVAEDDLTQRLGVFIEKLIAG